MTTPPTSTNAPAPEPEPEADCGPDFAVLHPDGRIHYHRHSGGPVHHAIRAAIIAPGGVLGTQGMGPLRAWYTDDFTGLARNPLADRVLTVIGYRHPTGWRGLVAITAEDDPHTGDRPALDARLLPVRTPR